VSRPCVFAVFNLNEVYLPRIDIELVSSANSAHKYVNQLEALGGDRQTKNHKSPISSRFPEVHVSNVPLHFPHPKTQVSSEI